MVLARPALREAGSASLDLTPGSFLSWQHVAQQNDLHDGFFTVYQYQFGMTGSPIDVSEQWLVGHQAVGGSPAAVGGSQEAVGWSNQHCLVSEGGQNLFLPGVTPSPLGSKNQRSDGDAHELHGDPNREV